jgi:signal transduction histidine kinase
MPMQRVHESTISKRLMWMNMVVSGAALLLACTTFVAYDFLTFREAMVRNLSIQAEMIGSNSASALLFDDQTSAEKTLSALRASPNVISAGVCAPDGRALAVFNRGAAQPAPGLPALTPGQTETHWFKDGQLIVVHSIIFDGAPTGTVYIQADLNALYGRLERYALIVAAVLLVSLIAASLVSWMSQRAVSEPIVKLADLARSVSRDKNYAARAAINGSHGELAALIESFNEMLAQIQQRDRALQGAHDELEQRVQERTHQLAVANKELEAFSYSVSHDLRAPLRGIDGFSQALLEDHAEQLNEDGKDLLDRVRSATQRMSTLIDDLLDLSRITRSEMQTGSVDLSELAGTVAEELKKTEPGRNVEFVIADGLTATGDSHLLRVVMENLLGNAWKYTSGHPRARIELGSKEVDGRMVYFVRDDGAGFDPTYSSRLFGAFQRLHTASEFPGTGVGLASVQRIIHRHGGTITAEAAVEKGATFYFTL